MLLRRAGFLSKADIKHRIERFIACFKQTMAKPFKIDLGRKAMTIWLMRALCTSLQRKTRVPACGAESFQPSSSKLAR
jgi:hypothetical protein